VYSAAAKTFYISQVAILNRTTWRCQKTLNQPPGLDCIICLLLQYTILNSMPLVMEIEFSSYTVILYKKKYD